MFNLQPANNFIDYIKQLRNYTCLLKRKECFKKIEMKSLCKTIKPINNNHY